jgi:N-acylneuraminate cytidylyltransferase/pseudaminic acid cytidylyltransferase
MNLCVIPARGGSKRIPKKNIKLFHGKPLIAYSIETAKKSELFDKVVVSTDDGKIAKVAEKYGAEVLIRPKELADDYTGTGDVFNHAIETLNKDGKYKYACMIYPTAPFLRVEYLKEGYEKLKNSDACASFSVTSFEYPIQRAFKIVNGRCEMFDKSQFYKRSQDLEVAYHDAGQFYWKKIGCRSDDVFFGKDTIPIVIPRYLVQDIDTLEDFKRAEIMYEVLNEVK